MNYLIHSFWMIFIFLLANEGIDLCNDHQRNRGIAMSNYWLETYGQHVDPAEARFFNVVGTSYEITLEEVEVFLPGRK